jgi:hypothetical protein
MLDKPCFVTQSSAIKVKKMPTTQIPSNNEVFLWRCFAAAAWIVMLSTLAVAGWPALLAFGGVYLMGRSVR